MDVPLTNLPIIDWEAAINATGNKPAFAEEIMAMFMKDLPNDWDKIEEYYITKNYSELLRQIHRLHGAICYLGMPRLKLVLARIEMHLKTDLVEGLPILMLQLNNEVMFVMEYYAGIQRQKTGSN